MAAPRKAGGPDALVELEEVAAAIRELRVYYTERKADPVILMTQERLGEETGLGGVQVSRLLLGRRAWMDTRGRRLLLKWWRGRKRAHRP